MGSTTARLGTISNPSWLVLSRLTWITLFILILGMWVAGTRVLILEPVTDCIAVECDPVDLNAGDVEIAQALGIPTGFLSGTFTLSYNLLLGGLYFVIALVIFWRKSRDWMVLLVSLTLVFLGGLIFTSTDDALVRAFPAVEPLRTVLVSIGIVLIIFLFLVFPDGRFVPHKARWAGITLLILFLVLRLIPALNSLIGDSSNWVIVVLFPLSIFAQLYRYSRVSSPTEKQQTKWAVVGLIGALALMVTWITLGARFPPGQPSPSRIYALFVAVPLISFFGVLLPTSFAFSILRYRLWDIDIIIRRTLQYTLLTGILALIYFGGVILLQAGVGAVTGQGNVPLVTVVTTLGIAALFNPLRHRVQDFIDRRFYRQKYDAELAIAHFAALARDEIEFERLTTALLDVVDETMHPETINLRLKS